MKPILRTLTLCILTACGVLLVACNPIKPRSVCGNGTIERDEECDGDQLSGATCESHGYYGGSISCNDACRLSFVSCEGGCGDGIVQDNEQCDSENLWGVTCKGLGYAGGELACTGECTFDESACYAFCGDGIVDAPYERCDGQSSMTLTCDDFWDLGGVLECDSCQLDMTGCSRVIELLSPVTRVAYSTQGDHFILSTGEGGARWQALKVNSAFQQVWVREFQFALPGDNHVGALFTRDASSILIVGKEQVPIEDTTLTQDTLFFTTLNSVTGEVLTSVSYTPGNGMMRWEAVLDGQGIVNVLVVPSQSGNYIPDPYIMRFDLDGAFIDSVSVGDGSQIIPWRLVVDGDGEVLLLSQTQVGAPAVSFYNPATGAMVQKGGDMECEELCWRAAGPSPAGVLGFIARPSGSVQKVLVSKAGIESLSIESGYKGEYVDTDGYTLALEGVTLTKWGESDTIWSRDYSRVGSFIPRAEFSLTRLFPCYGGAYCVTIRSEDSEGKVRNHLMITAGDPGVSIAR